MRIIAHRGRQAGAAENTTSALCSLTSAVAGIEVDVRVTSDGVPILMHDMDVGRTTSACGSVEAMAYSKVQELRVRGTEEAPPELGAYLRDALVRLEEVCVTSRPDIYLDVKVRRADLRERLAQYIASTPFYRRVVCLGRTAEDIASFVVGGGSRLRLGMLGCNRQNAKESIGIAEAFGLEVLFIRHGFRSLQMNSSVIAEIRARGIECGGSVLSGEAALRYARAVGCEVVLADL